MERQKKLEKNYLSRTSRSHVRILRHTYFQLTVNGQLLNNASVNMKSTFTTSLKNCAKIAVETLTQD